MRYSSFIEDVLKKTSIIALSYFGKVSGRTKPDDNNQVLTDADLEIGKFITGEIEKEFPSYNIIDEEFGAVDKGSEFTWVIDPIDGTSNFAEGVVTYGTMIGLLEKATPVAGGLSLPSLGQIVVAQKGKGAFLNRKKIQVTKETDLKKTLVSFGADSRFDNSDKTREEMKIIAEILLNARNIRSSNSVFDIVMLAKGSYGAWVCFTGKIWDHVAPQIVIEEAGGVYTSFYGAKNDYSDTFNKTKQRFTNCAASPALHKKLQEIIHGNLF